MASARARRCGTGLWGTADRYAVRGGALRLRTFAKIGVLTLPILAGGAGMTGEMSVGDVTTTNDDFGGER